MLTGRSAAEPKLLTAKPLKEIVSKLSPSGKDTRARQSLQQLKNQHATNGAQQNSMRRNKIDLPNKNSKVILEKLANAQKQEPQKLNSLGEP